MRWLRLILSACFLAALAGRPALAANHEVLDPPAISCGNGVPGGINCAPSKQDLKDARIAYALGLKSEKHSQLPEAFAAFDEASRWLRTILISFPRGKSRNRNWF